MKFENKCNSKTFFNSSSGEETKQVSHTKHSSRCITSDTISEVANETLGRIGILSKTGGMTKTNEKFYTQQNLYLKE